VIVVLKCDNSVSLTGAGMLKGTDILTPQKNIIQCDTAGGANFELVSIDGGGTTTISTGVARDANYHKWRLVRTPTLFEIFRWESSAWVSKASTASNLPTGASQIAIGARTLDASTAKVDYSYIKGRNTA